MAFLSKLRNLTKKTATVQRGGQATPPADANIFSGVQLNQQPVLRTASQDPEPAVPGSAYPPEAQAGDAYGSQDLGYTAPGAPADKVQTQPAPDAFDPRTHGLSEAAMDPFYKNASEDDHLYYSPGEPLSGRPGEYYRELKLKQGQQHAQPQAEPEPYAIGPSPRRQQPAPEVGDNTGSSFSGNTLPHAEQTPAPAAPFEGSADNFAPLNSDPSLRTTQTQPGYGAAEGSFEGESAYRTMPLEQHTPPYGEQTPYQGAFTGQNYSATSGGLNSQDGFESTQPYAGQGRSFQDFGASAQISGNDQAAYAGRTNPAVHDFNAQGPEQQPESRKPLGTAPHFFKQRERQLPPIEVQGTLAGGFSLTVILFLRQLIGSFFTHTNLDTLMPRLSPYFGPCYPSSMPIPYFFVGCLATLPVVWPGTLNDELLNGSLSLALFTIMTGIKGFRGLGNMLSVFSQRRPDVYFKCVCTVLIALLFVYTLDTIEETIKPDLPFVTVFGALTMLSALAATSINFGAEPDPVDSYGVLKPAGLLFAAILTLVVVYLCIEPYLATSMCGVALFLRVILGYFINRHNGRASRDMVCGIQLLTMLALLAALLLGTEWSEVQGPVLYYLVF